MLKPYTVIALLEGEPVIPPHVMADDPDDAVYRACAAGMLGPTEEAIALVREAWLVQNEIGLHVLAVMEGHWPLVRGDVKAATEYWARQREDKAGGEDGAATRA